MPLSPYLSFAGNCSDAIAYINVRWARNCSIKSASAKCRNSAGQRRELPFRNAISRYRHPHANVRIAGSDIMMSDAMPSEKPATPALRWCSIRNRSKKETLV